MNIAVYISSKFGNDEKYERKAVELGEAIAEMGHTLVYGGSREGLMGVLAEAAVAKGGDAIGVLPSFFIGKVHHVKGLKEEIIVDTMAERRNVMIELSDLFIAFPGGPGTLDELSEIMTLEKLDQVNGELILYNLDGYYDSLCDFIKKMMSEGFLFENELENIIIFDTIDEIIQYINNKEKKEV